MIGRPAASSTLAVLLALGGCNDTGGETPPSADGVSATPAGLGSTPTSSADAGSASGTGSNLSANTSSLTANSSDLNSRIVGMNRIVELPSDVLFDFDSAELKPQAEAALRQVADAIRSAPQGSITIIGHTDSMGSDAYNLDLSTRRAQAVRDWMGEQVGVRQRDFEVSGAGEGDPVMPNANPDGSDSEEGRSRNRRVEVVIHVE